MYRESTRLKNNMMCFIILLQNAHIKGFENLANFLMSHRFYDAPSSDSHHHHHCWKGGWVEHALGVYIRAVNHNRNVSNRSIVVAALLHDICKLDEFYIDHNGLPARKVPVHKGHGWASVTILRELGLDLTGVERRAIRWHMGGKNADTLEKKVEFNKTKNERLYQLIHEADKEDAKYGGKMHSHSDVIMGNPDVYLNIKD